MTILQKSSCVLRVVLRGRVDQNAKQIVNAEADLLTGHPEDARVSAAKHLDPGAATEAEFFQPVDVVGLSGNAADKRRAADGQITQRDGPINHGGFLDQGGTVTTRLN